MISKLAAVGGGQLIGTAVFQCALLTDYFLSTAMFQVLGAPNAIILRSNI